MEDKYMVILSEIKKLQKDILSKQQEVLDNTMELREEQKKLRKEIELSNFVSSTQVSYKWEH